VRRNEKKAVKGVQGERRAGEMTEKEHKYMTVKTKTRLGGHVDVNKNKL
jgi:hypothetical protein